MSAAGIAAAAAVAAVLVTILGGMILLIYNAGRHAQRLDTHETELAELKRTQAEHTKAISVWDRAEKLLEEVRRDVKGLLTGKVRPARRVDAAD